MRKIEYNRQSIVINEETELLEFLYSKYSYLPKKLVKSFLTEKRVSVNNKVVTQYNYLLKPKQTLNVKERLIPYQREGIEIIYEDESLIVIDKPYGLLSMANPKEKQKTAYHFVSDYYKKQNKSNRLFVIHRLDQDTSGILMFGKNQKIQDLLQNNWEEYVTKRGYLALVEGQIEKNGRVHSYLKETKTHLVYSTKDKAGLEAITNYEIVKYVGDKTLLQIYLETGRKNQIRVHMKDIEHPIVGDKKYGSKGKRLCLHANELEFYHPIKKEKIVLKSNINFK